MLQRERVVLARTVIDQDVCFCPSSYEITGKCYCLLAIASKTREEPWPAENGYYCNFLYAEADRGYRCFGQRSGCCTSERQCVAGDGNCHSDDQCWSQLKCGAKNCIGQWFDKDVDCCEAPGVADCNLSYGKVDGGRVLEITDFSDAVDCVKKCWGKSSTNKEINGVSMRTNRKAGGVMIGDLEVEVRSCFCVAEIAKSDSNMAWRSCSFDLKSLLRPMRCSGQDRECCTSETPCEVGQGDCDANSDCKSGLVCMENSCTGPTFDPTDDCCVLPKDTTTKRCYGQEHGCCTMDTPCDHGEGHCQSDEQCKGLMTCGKKNCKGPGFTSTNNCCTGPVCAVRWPGRGISVKVELVEESSFTGRCEALCSVQKGATASVFEADGRCMCEIGFASGRDQDGADGSGGSHSCAFSSYGIHWKTCTSEKCSDPNSEAFQGVVFSDDYDDFEANPFCLDGLDDDTLMRRNLGDVVCRMLNKGGGVGEILKIGQKLPSQYDTNFLMKNIKCAGTEESVGYCAGNEAGNGCSNGAVIAQCLNCNDADVFEILTAFDTDAYPKDGHVIDLKELPAKIAKSWNSLVTKCGIWSCDVKPAHPVWCKAERFFYNINQTITEQPRRRLIQTDLKHSELLKHDFQQRGFGELHIKLDDISAQSDEFKTQLASYFRQLGDFDLGKATMDRDYLKATIKEANDGIAAEQGKIMSMLKKILPAAMKTSTVDLAEKAILVAEATAGSLNPFTWLSGGVLGDVIGATNDLAGAAIQIVEVKLLMNDLAKLAVQADKIRIGLRKNDELHKNFLTFVDDNVDLKAENVTEASKRFVELFGAFGPGVTSAQLAEYASVLENTLETGCSFIMDSSSAVNAPTKAALLNDCGNIKIFFARLGVQLDDTYSMQFEIMDAGAEMARAIIARAQADELSRTVKDNFHDQVKSMDVKWRVLLSSYIHKQRLIDAALDVIEYKNSGSLPDMLLDVKSNPFTADLGKLISYNYGKSICDEGSLTAETVYIPATVGAVGDGKIDLRELYENGFTTFKIPSFKYATDNHWISETNSQMYVKQFALYLPPEEMRSKSGHIVKHRVELEVSHSQAMQLSPNGVKYFFPDKHTFLTQYDVNAYRCRGNKIFRCEPYKVPTCKSPVKYPTCRKNDGGTDDEYLPTMFGEWTIILRNNNGKYDTRLRKLRMPNVVGKLDLVARVTVCGRKASEKRSDVLIDSSSMAAVQRSSSSCRNDYDPKLCCFDRGQVWSHATHECSSCPANSKPTLQGYYCEASKRDSGK